MDGMVPIKEVFVAMGFVVLASAVVIVMAYAKGRRDEREEMGEECQEVEEKKENP